MNQSQAEELAGVHQPEEIEQIDESGIINAPFDPNTVKISNPPQNIGDILDRIEHKEINLVTDFQRQADLWDKTKQSQLIESILLRFPLPAFYFDGQDDNKWQVVDGLQRISTLKNFAVDKSLKLQGLEFLTQFHDQGFDDLPRELQRRIKSFPITVHVIEKGAPDEVKYNIFSRINKGGLVLEPQEIRHALNQGVAANFVKELSEIPEFKEATCWSIRSERMQDRDFVTRFVSFYLVGFGQYQPDLDSFMNRGMKQIPKEAAARQAILDDFKRAMKTAVQIFGNDAFRKRYDPKATRKPINKALFEVLSVCFAKLTATDCQQLANKAELFRTKFIEIHTDDPAFLRAITQGTGQKDNVERRFSTIQKIIQETLQA
ncbi:MAG: DUF262 domain-containing protein [Saprospiraceae bacterium]